FALLVLILVIASFVNVVAGTFFTAADAPVTFGITTNPTGNQTTAMISMLFIVLAIIYGILTNRCGMKTLPATILGLIGIVGIVVFGLNVGLAMSRVQWIVLIGVYIAVASLIPVWIMLQPRDYLSSFLLYAMMAVAVIGIVISAFSGRTEFSIPAFTGWSTKIGTLFPALFITVACGACSGFHSLIATGTSSKQLDNEKHAKAIGYGSMLIESALGIVALIAVGMVFDSYLAGEFGSPSAAFAGGIALMFGEKTSSVYGTIYALLTLSVSVFALTSLDTGTRLSRFMFSELFLKDGEATWKDAKGARKVLAHPLFGTVSMVVIGCILGGLSLSQIWGLFGAANQLLAGIALMAVAAWLGNAGKNNKMFYVPMVFMLAATLCSLVITIKNKIVMIAAAEAAWGDWFQLIFAAAMAVLALFLVVEGYQSFKRQKANRAHA
ncbi:MAG: carbon starvation CstA family protein, partial [Lachnospiraceae bacterium]